MAKAPAKHKDNDEDLKDKDEDSESAEGAEGGEESGGKKLNAKKIVLFIVLPLFLLGGGGAGLYFSGMLDKFLKKDEVVAEGEEHPGKKEDHAKAKGGGHGEAAVAGAAFLEIPNMLVNLSGPEEQPRYLRLKVQLELENQSDLEAVQAVMPRVVDQFQTYLRELRIKDLRGSAGIYRLQMELLSRVNAAAYPTEVKDVLFQEILIQ